jgi:hypothetical protein
MHKKQENRLKRTNIGKKGTKQVYKCKFNKSSGCEAKCYLLYHDDDDGVSHYHSIIEHNEHISDNSHGITSKYKDAIDSIYALFQKPKQIKAQLINMFPKNNKDDFPTVIQLKNYIANKCTKQGYKAMLNLGELEKWCLEHEKVPEDVDCYFKLEENSHKVVFFIFFTTKRLLSLANNLTKHMCRCYVEVSTTRLSIISDRNNRQSISFSSIWYCYVLKRKRGSVCIYF